MPGTEMEAQIRDLQVATKRHRLLLEGGDNAIPGYEGLCAVAAALTQDVEILKKERRELVVYARGILIGLALTGAGVGTTLITVLTRYGVI
jgi:hypothetical protein|tara:strand:- start:3192 stop:3464 length:273 start_codon:yes stop_codon:yes gene_type:complete